MTKKEINEEIERVKKEQRELFDKEQELYMQKMELEREERRKGLTKFMLKIAGECFGAYAAHIFYEDSKRQKETLVYVSDYMDE